MKRNCEFIDLGEFEMTSPVMRVSDPCYERDVWCCGTVDHCKLGTGQAGFFDDAFYQNDTVFEDLPAPGFAIGDLWYRHVCDITLSKMSAGVLPYGAVSSSGFGDGGYTCYTHADENGVIDFAFIVFI